MQVPLLPPFLHDHYTGEMAIIQLCMYISSFLALSKDLPQYIKTLFLDFQDWAYSPWLLNASVALLLEASTAPQQATPEPNGMLNRILYGLECTYCCIGRALLVGYVHRSD